MDQKSSEILVPPFGDPKKFLLASGRVLSRGEPEPGSEVTRTPELFAIADGRQQRAGAERADTRDRRETASDVVAGNEGFDLRRNRLDAQL